MPGAERSTGRVRARTPATATPTSKPRWVSRRCPHPERTTPTWRPGTGVSRPGGGRSAPSLLSNAPSSPRSGTCSPTTRNTPISAATTTSGATRCAPVQGDTPTPSARLPGHRSTGRHVTGTLVIVRTCCRGAPAALRPIQNSWSSGSANTTHPAPVVQHHRAQIDRALDLLVSRGRGRPQIKVDAVHGRLPLRHQNEHMFGPPVPLR